MITNNNNSNYTTTNNNREKYNSKPFEIISNTECQEKTKIYKYKNKQQNNNI